MKTANLKSILIIVLFFVMFVVGIAWLNKLPGFSGWRFKNDQPINGLIMLIEFEKIDGILQWEKELDKRNLTAMVKVQNNILKDYPEVFKRLASKGYEIAGGYDEEPFWDMPYEKQYQYLKEAKDLVESTTGLPMRVFGSRYFAYDENTLKAADDLGIEYILARGTQDVAAVIYDPAEYDVKVISVTNVENGEMGRGSLCDYSLWARGADAQEFATILEASLAKKPKNMILVSHSYLGGTRQEWWEEYRKVLENDKVSWVGFETWLEKQELLTMPNSEIPINREVKYVQPKPAKPMENYAPVPNLESAEVIMFHNNLGEMCLEAIEFFKTHQIEYKEYLNTNSEFRQILTQYQQEYPASIGESENYQYLPIIFYEGKAYSGFNEQVAQSILSDWESR